LGITWAKKGKTPIIKQGCSYQHLSAISAISEQGELYFSIQEVNYTGQSVVEFLKSLLSFFDQKLLIIWDGAKIHANDEVKAFLEQDIEYQIFLAKLPPYSPMLNADEQVWQTLKDDMLKNVVCKNLSELKQKVQTAFKDLQEQVPKIISFFKHPEVAFYKS